MNRFVSFMGKRVEAQYRVADIHQKSVGTLVSDTGRSIVVEDRILQGGRKKTMRVEIPYEYAIRLTEEPHGSEFLSWFTPSRLRPEANSSQVSPLKSILSPNLS